MNNMNQALAAYYEEKEYLKLEGDKVFFTQEGVSWECIRNIANVLTNQIYLAEETDPGSVSSTRAHMSLAPVKGADRYWSTEDMRLAGKGGQRWASLGPETREMAWTSATSKSRISATNKGSLGWTLEFSLGEDPHYRGAYFDLVKNHKQVEALDMDYVHQRN